MVNRAGDGAIYFGVTVGDNGKDTVVRGVWIRNRGLSTLFIAIQ
jgi:hypothetical protein